jgi:(p)ppGpp synthase/HD superfamily hydrolase
MKLETQLSHIQRYHADVFDSQGVPYWIHPYRVSRNAARLVDQYNFQRRDKTLDYKLAEEGGLLHDVFEDTHYTFTQIAGDGFSIRAIDIAKFLDFDSPMYASCKTYDDKIDLLIGLSEKGLDNRLEMIVKLADNIDNSQRWRSKKPGVANEKYYKSMTKLSSALDVIIPLWVLGDVDPFFSV